MTDPVDAPQGDSHRKHGHHHNVQHLNHHHQNTKLPRNDKSKDLLNHPWTSGHSEQISHQSTNPTIEQGESSIETLLLANKPQEEAPKDTRGSTDVIIDSDESLVKVETKHDWLMNWMLAIFVFSILAWVNIWNILAAHTQVAREKIYPFFESTYFEGKAGARVFTFLGVFHILAGTMSLFCLSRGMRLPKPTPFMVKPLHFALTGERWTIFEIFVLGVFVAVQIATIITRVKNKFYNDWDPDWEPGKLWYEITKTLGKTAAITILFLFIPVSKSSFWLDLFNMKFERAIKFHRWLAWFLVTVVVFHAASAVASLASDGQFKNCMWPSENCIQPDADWGTYESLKISRIITYGWLAFLTAIPLVITSLPWFRRHKFEWFYFTHFLFVPCMVLLHLHFYDMIYYAAPGLAAYVLDKVMWFCSSRRAIRMVSLSTPVRGFVRMEIAVEQCHTFEPGQWVQIKVPAVSAFQWHPMSVASAPGHSTIQIDVKVLGDWTQGLQDLALRFDPSKYTHTCVFLDRFQGSSHTQMQSYLNHPAVLMVAGGIGITPMMSSLRMLVEMGIPGVHRAVLVWVVRKESVVDLYREELSCFQSMGYTKFGCKVDVIVHATLLEKEDPKNFVAVDIDTTPKPSAVSHCKQWPFQRHLMGHEHLLVLTLGAGGGYLLGIFLANYFALDKQWREEYVSLLQLCLAVLFDGVLATVGMSRSFFCQGSVWTENDLHHGTLTQNESFGLSSTPSITPSKNDSSQLPCGASRELHVVLGCRPDLKDIFHDMKEWCEANGSSSVGVSVCGSDTLIQSVMKTSRQTSSSSLPFVVDDETYEL